MTDIVERLREYASTDHKRGCEGRCYSCTCGYDDERDHLLVETADEIERLEAELKRQTADKLVSNMRLIETETEIERLLIERLLAALKEIAGNKTNSRAWLEDKARRALEGK
jgi:hypothetical protein